MSVADEVTRGAAHKQAEALDDHDLNLWVTAFMIEHRRRYATTHSYVPSGLGGCKVCSRPRDEHTSPIPVTVEWGPKVGEVTDVTADEHGITISGRITDPEFAALLRTPLRPGDLSIEPRNEMLEALRPRVFRVVAWVMLAMVIALGIMDVATGHWEFLPPLAVSGVLSAAMIKLFTTAVNLTEGDRPDGRRSKDRRARADRASTRGGDRPAQ